MTPNHEQWERAAALIYEITGEKVEIGDMPDSFLPKLIRALEAGALAKVVAGIFKSRFG